MRFISSLCWVKKGASSTPSKIALEKSELKKLFELNEPGDEHEADSEDSIDKKYNLDNYDDEGELEESAKVLSQFNLKHVYL